MDFLDRQREMTQLESAWQRSQADLITLWGRRRVGKSTLLAEFARDKRGLYFYGTRMPLPDLLADFSRQAAELLDDPYLARAPFASWEIALEELSRRLAGQRWVLILDEFSYLCEVSPGLDTLVQRWWDNNGQHSQVLTIIAGSAFSFMEGLVGTRGPLHGRRTGQLDLRPFDYRDAALFYPHLSPADRVRAYACLGGMPAYLRHFQPGEPLAAALKRTVLAREHALFREAEELLRTEFHRQALYAAILRAVAQGEARPSDIARAAGKSSADQIFDHLQRLQELGLLEREVPVTERGRPRLQRVLYRLAEPYLRFWYKFVSPHQSLLFVTSPDDFWEREVAPRLDEFVARTAWEEVVRQALWRRLPARVSDLGRWWDSANEFDVVGVWEGAVTLIGECKWTNSPLSLRDLHALRARSSVLSPDREAIYLLASRSGFRADLKKQEGVLLLTPEELY